jgi:hypothetical protein
LEDYLAKLAGKQRVCMDLARVYRAVVHKHFPNAKIADSLMRQAYAFRSLKTTA